jgi:hypothetical protein
MWIYDGEEWVNEGSGSSPENNEREREPRYLEDEMLPQLQIIEIPRIRERVPPPFPYVIP